MDFSTLCPSYGRDGDVEDKECQACVAQEECMRKTVEFKAAKEMETSKVSPYGHRTSAVTGQIDWLLYRGATFPKIMQETGCSYSRLRRHLNKLERAGHKIVRKDDGGITTRKVTTTKRGEQKMETQQEGKSPNGHRLDSLPGKIDTVMHELKGDSWPTAAQVAEVLGISVGKVNAHINYWRDRNRYE